MKQVVILGYPLMHSVSPAFQQAAFDHLGLGVTYNAWETEPADLEAALERLRQDLFLGANVTIPHKEATLAHMDDVDKAARDIGAVNTVVRRDGRLIGYNTDYEGFLRALRVPMPSVMGKRAILLGAGGAARAVGYALVRESIGTLVIANRNRQRAEALAKQLWRFHSVRTMTVPMGMDDPRLPEAINRCHLLVNATPVGMAHTTAEGQTPVPQGWLASRTIVFDLVYNPERTALLQAAMAAGAKAWGGLDMLVHQGALSFELWTGQPAPLAVMFKAAREALGQ
ncbi:MAG: shikimate dehydrogenase [Chloroflexi bacterium]|nr:shikimate dehydrogenase [Chloroflexota bacterium]